MASMSTVVINPHAVNRLKCFLNDPMYKEAIEHSASYNTRLCIERKMRLPFLDAQTGVAQNNCYLWMQKRQRMPGESPGQLYTYPSKRWRKKRRQYLVNFLRPPPRRDLEVHDMDQLGNDSISRIDDDNSNSNNNSNNNSNSNNNNNDRHMDDSKDSWYKDYEDMADIPDAGELDDPESDFDDYEEIYMKRKKKKTPAKRGTKRSDKFDPATEMEKPYHCEVCGARYKTRPGLSYHVTHSHQNQPPPPEPAAVDDENTALSPPKVSASSSMVPNIIVGSLSSGNVPINLNTNSNSNSNSAASSTSLLNASAGNSSSANTMMMNQSSSSSTNNNVSTTTTTSGNNNNAAAATAAAAAAAATNDALAGLKKFQDSFLSFLKHPESPPNLGQKPASPAAGGKPPAAPSPYCDFCLGDATENKKTKQAEELVSCSDCGRSGHPSCLQFTANMMISVKKYRWQCIECKCCTLCGTSDNDDQLLFCDDCDRGYHMYCLDPPLAEPPEGSWSCHLCIQEFHKK